MTFPTDDLFQYALSAMDRAFLQLESSVPPPVPVPMGDGIVFRYQDRSLHQAIVLKLAAVVSRLRASTVLLRAGYASEQAVLHRLIDELNEDVLFLTLAATNDRLTDLHKRYLRSFFAEEFDDPADIVASRRDRDLVPRKKIRAYIARIARGSEDPHRETEVAKTIGNMYSGFVHGAAPHILDCYGGNPPRFHTAGLLGTPRIREHTEDSWNYHYRSLLSFAAAAKAFGNAPLHGEVQEAIHEFERRSGTRYSRALRTSDKQ